MLARTEDQMCWKIHIHGHKRINLGPGLYDNLHKADKSAYIIFWQGFL